MTLKNIFQLVKELDLANKTAEQLLEEIESLHILKKQIDDAFNRIKEYVKYKEIDEIEKGNIKIKRSVYIKLSPIDINLILEKYPINEYKDLYNISLSSKAKQIITDPNLVQKKYVETVKVMEKKNKEDEDLV